MNSPALDTALNQLSSFVVSDSSLVDLLDMIVRLVRDTVPGADFVGLTLQDDKETLSTPIYTDESSPLVDRAQYDAQSGPCVDAFRLNKAIRIDDLGETELYPEFVAVASEHGVCSVLSVPLVANNAPVGALNMYALQAKAFTTSDEDVASRFSAIASVVLLNANAYWNARMQTEDLNQAMRSRAVIEQAKGMLMARRRGLTSDDAFSILRQASQRENVKLRDIAQRVVERGMVGESVESVEANE